MATALRLPTGAPGLRWLPPEPVRALTNVRMDVCAFVGVAPRGPAHVAVAVESWTEYTRLFGAYEGPGLLPYAVASYFENGGMRAYIVRICHDATGVAPIASAPLGALLARTGSGDAPVILRARNEGAWGNALSARLGFTTRPLPLAATAFSATELVYPKGVELSAGTLLRLEHAGGVHTLVTIARLWEAWHPSRAIVERHATFVSLVALPILRADVVEGVLDVDDGDGRTEHHESLGTSPEHPRWMSRVLAEESTLLAPLDDVVDTLVVDVALPTYATSAFSGGANRWSALVPEDFFDASWVIGDEDAGRGVHALTHVDDLSIVVAPDLYSPKPLAPLDVIVDAGGAGADFCACVDIAIPTQDAPLDHLDGLRLDPALDLTTIVGLQRRLIELADSLESWVALLDVPPGLSQRQVLEWRGELHSMYAAAYHPWLRVARTDDRRDAAIDVNPSALAAGIIAQRALTLGVQYGPANVIAEGVFDVTDRISPARHDALHPNAINVLLHERDGVRLTAARTLSPNADYRQLSVRRLMTMLRRVLYAQMQWAVFEPNSRRLRDDVRNQLDAYLRQLFAAGAFRGARAEDAFFVRCDETLNTQQSMDQGRLIAHVGVAPAEPLEFLVVQLVRDGDGTLRVEG